MSEAALPPGAPTALSSPPSGASGSAPARSPAGAAPAIRVTVALCTFNRSARLRQTLEGVARQTFPHSLLEVLVIDNASTDDTRAVVDSFRACQPAPRYVLETRQGLDFARNRAIAEARGDIILFGDDDILVERDWVSRMAAPFSGESASRIGAVGGEVVPVFPDGLPPWVAAWHAPLAFRPETGPLPPEHVPMGANLAFPRRLFTELGLFHTGLDRSASSYFSGGDSEMIRRVRAAGLEVWFVPEAAVQHQMPASRTTLRYAARHAFDSARSRVIDRAGRPGGTRYLLSRLPAMALKAVGCALLAALWALVLRTGEAKKALVRGWRCCGYIYQIPRSLCGRQ